MTGIEGILLSKNRQSKFKSHYEDFDQLELVYDFLLLLLFTYEMCICGDTIRIFVNLCRPKVHILLREPWHIVVQQKNIREMET